MTWCARCDVLTTGSAGDACPSCGEPILDPIGPARKERRGSIQVLEAEAPAEAEMVMSSTPPLPDPVTATRPGRRVSRRTIVSCIVLALAGTALGLATRDQRGAGKPHAGTTAAPTATPRWTPPLGEGVSGWVIFPLQRGFIRLELSTGVREEIDLGGESYGLVASRQTRRIAYVDDARVLYVTNQNGDLPRAVTADVDAFAWTQNGEALIVSRSQSDARGVGRFRIEFIAPEDRIPLLLAEGSSQLISVASKSGRHFVTLSDSDGPAVYEMAPGIKRLIRKGAVLLDVAPDGQRALMSTTGKPSLVLVDVDSRKATRVGPKAFIAGSATFSPDGKQVAISGTPHFTMEMGGCDGEGPSDDCPPFPLAKDQILWILDVPNLTLRSLHAFPADALTTPAWGPGGWLIFGSENHAYAFSVTDPSASMVDLTDDVGPDWLAPQYIA